MANSVNRREFLSPKTLLQAAKEVIGPSGSGPREAITEVGCEFFSWVMLAYQAYQGAHDKLTAHGVASEINLKQRPGFATENNRLVMLSEKLKVASILANTLNRQWRNAYEKERESCTSTTNSKGEEEKSCYKYYVWEEPTPLNGFNQQISNWATVFGNTSSSADRARNESLTAFDLSESTGVLYLPEVEVATTGPAIAALTFQTIVSTGFAFYEETARKIQESLSAGDVSGDDLIIDDHQAITRRSFMKLVAAAFATYNVKGRQRDFIKENANAADDIKKFAADTLAGTTSNPNEISRQELWTDPASLVQYLNDASNRINQALNSYNGHGFLGFSDNNWPPIKNTLDQLNQTVIDLRNWTTQNFSTNGSLGISDEMVTVLRSTKATREIRKYVSGKQFNIEYTRHFIDSLIAGGQLVLSAGVIEFINKLTSPIVDSMNLKLESS